MTNRLNKNGQTFKSWINRRFHRINWPLKAACSFDTRIEPKAISHKATGSILGKYFLIASTITLGVRSRSIRSSLFGNASLSRLALSFSRMTEEFGGRSRRPGRLSKPPRVSQKNDDEFASADWFVLSTKILKRRFTRNRSAPADFVCTAQRRKTDVRCVSLRFFALFSLSFVSPIFPSSFFYVFLIRSSIRFHVYQRSIIYRHTASIKFDLRTSGAYPRDIATLRIESPTKEWKFWRRLDCHVD